MRKAALSPDGRLLALAARTGEILLVPLDSGATRRGASGLTDPIALQFAPDGSELWVRARDGRTARVAPADATLIDDGFAWRTMVSGAPLTVDTSGTFALGDARARGALVVADGSLRTDGAVVVVTRADALARLPVDGSTPWRVDGPAQPALQASACAGACLLTAADAASLQTYFWRIAPFDATPTLLPGRVFLDDGRAAIDCGGRHALLEDPSGLARITLPPRATGAGLAPRPPRARSVPQAPLARAWLDGTGATAYALDATGRLRVFDAATMAPHPLPAAVGRHAPLIAASPRALLLRARDGDALLVAPPVRMVRRFAGDVEMTRPRFSATGALVAVRRDAGWTLYRTGDGRFVGRAADGELLFAPDDRTVVSVAATVSVHRLDD
ncbi:MAG TPA: hypothetical protein PLP74_06780 [Quisquiliibacterium sp.]|nr:hypothetical protein [Quisquiliibacterium sp.]HQN11809.1 hypothetical protein [Quisquiliibacterium sp.]